MNHLRNGTVRMTLTGTGMPSSFPGIQLGIMRKIRWASRLRDASTPLNIWTSLMVPLVLTMKLHTTRPCMPAL